MCSSSRAATPHLSAPWAGAARPPGRCCWEAGHDELGPVGALSCSHTPAQQPGCSLRPYLCPSEGGGGALGSSCGRRYGPLLCFRRGGVAWGGDREPRCGAGNGVAQLACWQAHLSASARLAAATAGWLATGCPGSVGSAAPFFPAAATLSWRVLSLAVLRQQCFAHAREHPGRQGCR